MFLFKQNLVLKSIDITGTQPISLCLDAATGALFLADEHNLLSASRYSDASNSDATLTRAVRCMLQYIESGDLKEKEYDKITI